MSVNNTDVYEEIEASVDSGAGVTIMPSEMCTHVPLRTRDRRLARLYNVQSGIGSPRTRYGV